MGSIRVMRNREASEAKLGRKCPYCDTDFVPKVDPNAMVVRVAGEVWRKAQCPKCGGKWHIVYAFARINGFQW